MIERRFGSVNEAEKAFAIQAQSLQKSEPSLIILLPGETLAPSGSSLSCGIRSNGSAQFVAGATTNFFEVHRSRARLSGMIIARSRKLSEYDPKSPEARHN